MTLRVLHIDTEMTWRGGENQLRLLVEGLNARGAAESHVAARPGSLAAERFRGLAKAVVEAPMRGGFALRAALRLARYCDSHGIQLLHAHTSNAHSLALLLKKLRPRLKVVVHRRVDYVPGSDWVNRRKYLTKAVDRYVTVSRAIGDILIKYGVPAEKVRVACSAVPYAPTPPDVRAEARRKLAQAYGIDESLVFIGNASALTHQKGYEPLLHALARIKRDGVRYHAFIAGDGELRDPLEKLRIELALEHDVTFLGFIDGVKEFLSALDVLAVPSRFEGLGTIILDGINAGAAVVASAVGGIPEMIVDGETGLLAPVEDVPRLAAQLTRAANDPELREKLNTAARAHIARAFSLDAMVEGNLAVYRELTT